MKVRPTIAIERANGEMDTYDPAKLRASLSRAGAREADIDRVVNAVEGVLREGMGTREIYKIAYRALRKRSRGTAGRYSLKQAILQLGPTGFPFEKYVAAMLAYQGFQTTVGVIVPGKCVDHEVDVVAEKGDQHYMVECKFHSDPKRKCDVKIPLYIQARFKDVEASWSERPGHQHKFHQGWLVTNTRFTTDAIQYGECVGLHLMSWDHPHGDGLRERVDRSGLHPITCLTTLTKAEKQRILDDGTVLCAEIRKDEKVLGRAGVDDRKVAKVMKEVEELCSLSNNKR
ncbi:MAG: restriction endonuclease [Flavobacteriales bacterium]|nr:restriction endonuclease [Flavobacteriales bacterium]